MEFKKLIATTLATGVLLSQTMLSQSAMAVDVYDWEHLRTELASPSDETISLVGKVVKAEGKTFGPIFVGGHSQFDSVTKTLNLNGQTMEGYSYGGSAFFVDLYDTLHILSSGNANGFKNTREASEMYLVLASGGVINSINSTITGDSTTNVNFDGNAANGFGGAISIMNSESDSNRGASNVSINGNFTNNHSDLAGGAISNIATMAYDLQLLSDSIEGITVDTDNLILNINATGDQVFKGNTTNGVGGAIANTGTVNFNVDTNKTLTFGTEGQSVNSSTDSIYNIGDLKFNNGHVMIHSKIENKEHSILDYTFGGSTYGNMIVGAGDADDDTNALVLAAAISQNNLTINDDGGLITILANLNVTGTLKNDGQLQFADGGTLTKEIIGSGTITVDNKLHIESYVDNDFIVGGAGELSANADRLNCDINNGGIYRMLGSSDASSPLTNRIQNLTNLAGKTYITGHVESQNNISQNILTIGDGTTESSFANFLIFYFPASDGSIQVRQDDGTVSVYDLVISKNATYKTNASKTTVSNSIINEGILEFTGGTNNSSVNEDDTAPYRGSIIISGDTRNEAFIKTKELNVNKGAKLSTITNIWADTLTLDKNAGLLNSGDLYIGDLNIKEDAELEMQALVSVNNLNNEGQIIDTSTSAIKPVLEVSGVLDSKAYAIEVNIKNNGVYNMQGATTIGGGYYSLDSDISGTGETIIIGRVGADSSKNIAQNKLTIGDGTTPSYFDNDYNGNSFDINVNDLSINAKGTLESDASKITTTNSIVNDGYLVLTGGKIGYDITGAGLLKIDGDVESDVALTQDLDVLSGLLAINANNLAASTTIEETGGLSLTGGTLNTNVHGTGYVLINGNVSMDAGKASVGEIRITENQTLNLTGGNFTKTVPNTYIPGEFLYPILSLENNSMLNLITGAVETYSVEAFNVHDNPNLSIDVNLTGTGAADNFIMTQAASLMPNSSKITISDVNILGLGENKTYTMPILNKNDAIKSDLTYYQDNRKIEFAGGANSTLVATVSEYLLDLATASSNNAYNDSVYVMTKNEELTGTVTTNGLTVKSATGATQTITGSGFTIADAVNLTLQDVNVGVEQIAFEALGAAYLDVVASAGKTIAFNSDIIGTNQVVTFSGGGVINATGVIDPVNVIIDANTTVNRSNYDSQVSYALNNGSTLRYTDDKYLSDVALKAAGGDIPNFSPETVYDFNSINFNVGTLDIANGATNSIVLKYLSLWPNTTSNIKVDVDLANVSMDTLEPATINVGSSAKLNVSHFNMLSDAVDENPVDVLFTNNVHLKDAITHADDAVGYSPIYKYDVDYNNSTGKFQFTRGSASSYSNVTPSVMAAPVGASAGAYLTVLDTNYQALQGFDALTTLPLIVRKQMKNQNKYAIVDTKAYKYAKDVVQDEQNSAFLRPYASFDTVNLSNGPKVNRVGYGTFFGADTNMIELNHGIDAIFSTYGSYNGASLNYDGVNIYQNGGSLGTSAQLFKDNYFLGLTGNIGALNSSANTAFGHESFNTFTSGLAAKTGYNFEFEGGKYILQPNMLLGYSFINTFDYKNASGLNIASDALNTMQIAPGVRFIANLENGFRPYASVQMMWNLFSGTEFSANSTTLPQFSVDPYVQYGVGLQKQVNDDFSGYGQVMLRNGGINGVALQFGFNWAVGDLLDKVKERL